MEGELEDSDRSLSSLIGNVPGIVYRCQFDRDWTMTYLSQSCSEITGYEPSELIDNKRLAWAEIIHPEDRERVWREIKESLEEDERFKVTYRITTKEDDEKWVWEQGTAIKDGEDNIEAIEGFITDITEKIEYQKKLENRERKVKELYEASAELERCRRKKEVYELAIESAERILGFYTSVLFIESDGNLEVKNSTDKSSFEKGDLLSLEDENLMVDSYNNNETYLVKDIPNQEGVGATQSGLKSGISVPIGDIGLFSAASKKEYYFDEFDLEMAKILASHVNEAVERIDSQQEKSLILETAEEHILYLDTDLNIQWANEEVKKFSEMEKDELTGEKCYQALKRRDEVCEDCPVERAIASGEQEEGIQKDDDGSYWLIRASPKLDEDGEVEGVVEIALDITQRKKAEMKLKENKEKIEKLLKATSQLERQQEIDDIYDVAINAIENILEIDLGAIFVLDGDKFHLKAETSGVPSHDLQFRDKDDGMLGKTFKTKTPDITHDIQSSKDAEPHLEEYKSGISVPIGDVGVFQAMSKEEGHFDEEDLNMLELLSNHISEAVKRVELHEKLEKSEKRYRSLFEESPIPIWEEDLSKIKSYLDDLKDSGIEDFEKYLTENPEEVNKLAEMTEINDINKTILETYKAESKKEIIENFDEILKDEAKECFVKEISAIARNESSFETSECVNYTLDGEKRYFYLKLNTIGEEIDYSKVIVSLVDITQLKETQKELQKSEKKYRSIFENTGTAMLMIEDDKTISLVNEEFVKLTGYSKEEIEDNMKWPRLVSEKDREKMLGYHKARRESDEKAPTNYEFTLINRFGDAKNVVIEIGLIPETEKTVASLMDITDYKKTFGALRESQEAFRLLLENTSDPVILVDKEQQIKDVNDSFRESLISDEEKVIDKPCKEFIQTKTDLDFGEKLKKVLSGKQDDFESEVLFLRGEKDEIPMKIHCNLVKDHKDNPLYVIGILRPG